MRGYAGTSIPEKWVGWGWREQGSLLAPYQSVRTVIQVTVPGEQSISLPTTRPFQWCQILGNAGSQLSVLIPNMTLFPCWVLLSKLWAASQALGTMHRKTSPNYNRIHRQKFQYWQWQNKIKVKKTSNTFSKGYSYLSFCYSQCKVHKISCLWIYTEGVMSVTHSATRNPAKRNTTFKAAVFLVSLASIFKPVFSVLRKKDSCLSMLLCSLQTVSAHDLQQSFLWSLFQDSSFHNPL